MIKRSIETRSIQKFKKRLVRRFYNNAKLGRYTSVRDLKERLFFLSTRTIVF